MVVRAHCIVRYSKTLLAVALLGDVNTHQYLRVTKVKFAIGVDEVALCLLSNSSYLYTNNVTKVSCFITQESLMAPKTNRTPWRLTLVAMGPSPISRNDLAKVTTSKNGVFKLS